jgi:hypothetical protein
MFIVFLPLIEILTKIINHTNKRNSLQSTYRQETGNFCPLGVTKYLAEDI